MEREWRERFAKREEGGTGCNKIRGLKKDKLQHGRIG